MFLLYLWDSLVTLELISLIPLAGSPGSGPPSCEAPRQPTIYLGSLKTHTFVIEKHEWIISMHQMRMKWIWIFKYDYECMECLTTKLSYMLQTDVEETICSFSPFNFRHFWRTLDVNDCFYCTWARWKKDERKKNMKIEKEEKKWKFQNIRNSWTEKTEKNNSTSPNTI